MTEATPLAFDLPAVQSKKLTIDFDGGNQSSDAGMLLLRGAEKKTGVIARLTAALRDRRDPTRIRHRLTKGSSGSPLFISSSFSAKVVAINAGSLTYSRYKRRGATKRRQVTYRHKINVSITCFREFIFVNLTPGQ